MPWIRYKVLYEEVAEKVDHVLKNIDGNMSMGINLTKFDNFEFLIHRKKAKRYKR
jgi:hypothetical protein